MTSQRQGFRLTHPGLDRRQHREAFYYAGFERLLAGDRQTAGEDFKKCVAANLRDYTEYESAVAELKLIPNPKLRGN